MIGCKKCGECCRWFSIYVPRIDEDVEKWVRYRNGRIEGNVVSLPVKCSMLAENNLCKIYEDRPITCMNFPLGATELRPPQCRFFEEE